MAHLVPITNTPRDYAWGAIDGVSRALGRSGGGGPEAELWLGSHPLSPSRRTGAGDGSWADLAEWEAGSDRPLPFLLKVLSAAHPLSLQAHPTPEQAAAGFAREEAARVPLTARERNYKDPHAKPELIVAVDDGFEALCGFRPMDETLAAIDALAAASIDPAPYGHWRELATAGVGDAFDWLLSGTPEVDELLAAATATAETDERFELITRLAGEYPGDPGILVALMINHVTLAAGEALWLPAGNIHAYLRGTGVELMGPSDNVLRGGLTPKHVDRAELRAVLDFTPGPPPRLTPVEVSEHVVSYRPASTETGRGVDFELLLVTGDASFETGSPAIAVVIEGGFALSAGDAAADLARGDIVFADAPTSLRASGSGRLFVATGI